jgi:hypothetical protein
MKSKFGILLVILAFLIAMSGETSADGTSPCCDPSDPVEPTYEAVPSNDSAALVKWIAPPYNKTVISGNPVGISDYVVTNYDWSYTPEVLTNGTLIPNGGFEEVAEEDLGCWYGWWGGTCNAGCYGQCRGICVRSLAGWTIATCYGGVYRSDYAPQGNKFLSAVSFPSSTDVYTSPTFAIEDQISFIATIGGCGKISIEIKPEGGSWTEIMRFRDLGSPPGSEAFCSSAWCGVCGRQCTDEDALGGIPWTTFIIDTSQWKGQNGQIRFKNTRCPSWCCGSGLGLDNIRTHVVIIPATIDIDPDTLNLKSKGKWITAYIELPEGYDVNDIDISTVLLNDAVSAESQPTEIGDYDSDSVADLMLKFDRAEVATLLEQADEVELTVTGEVAGTSFEGSDTIRVMSKEPMKPVKGVPSIWENISNVVKQLWQAITGIL